MSECLCVAAHTSLARVTREREAACHSLLLFQVSERESTLTHSLLSRDRFLCRTKGSLLRGIKVDRKSQRDKEGSERGRRRRKGKGSEEGKESV